MGGVGGWGASFTPEWPPGQPLAFSRRPVLVRGPGSFLGPEPCGRTRAGRAAGAVPPRSRSPALFEGASSAARCQHHLGAPGWMPGPWLGQQGSGAGLGPPHTQGVGGALALSLPPGTEGLLVRDGVRPVPHPHFPQMKASTSHPSPQKES